MFFFINLVLWFLFSTPLEIPINNYILNDNFPKKFTLTNHPLPFNCFYFEAHYYDEFDLYEDTYINPIIKHLKITILFSDESIFDIKITDKHKLLSHTIEHTKSNFLIYLNKTTEKYELDNPTSLYKIIIINEPLAIQVLRKSTGEYIYNSHNSSLIFTDKYIEIQSKINTDFIMGFGERNFKSRLDVGDIYTTWSRDEKNVIENGWPPGKNIYGCHPMYLAKEASGNFNIGFLRTSNAFDTMLLNDSFKIISVFFSW